MSAFSPRDVERLLEELSELRREAARQTELLERRRPDALIVWSMGPASP